MVAKKDTKKEAKKVEKKGDRKLFSKKSEDTSDRKPRPCDYQIFLGPVVTEKSSIVNAQSSSGPGSSIVMRVDKRATKGDIREAVERIFKVNVVKVRTANYLGKPKRTARSSGRRAGFKRAIITLKEGQTVSIVEGL